MSTAAAERAHRIARTPAPGTPRRTAGAREDDGAGLRAVHPTTPAGRGAGGRTCRRVVRGVPKRSLRGAGASHDVHVQRKGLSVRVIAALVALHERYW